MSYAFLSVELLDHPKIADAGARLGPNGRVIALGFYALALLWCNHQHTDGVIPDAIMDGWTAYAIEPRAIADALVDAGLFARDRRASIPSVHIRKFLDYNPSCAEIKARRARDRERKRAHRAQNTRGNGHA